MPVRAPTPARRKAAATYASKRKEAGFKAVTVWLAPDVVAVLEQLKAEHGSNDAAVTAALRALAGENASGDATEPQ